jgi:RNA recognition motif-containing protein
MRFKNSKKRCNLYVKNFPPNTTEQQLKEFFAKFGEIESVKIFSKDGEAVYAFVCFKNPDNAALAKQHGPQQTFNNKTLYINHYEIKEIRKI